MGQAALIKTFTHFLSVVIVFFITAVIYFTFQLFIIVKVVEKVKTEAAKEVIQVAQKIEAVTSSLESGKTLYTKCAGCHGVNAEKPALGKSQIIKGWSVAKITEALNGYKDGSYGGAMKGVMKGQASSLSDSDIADEKAEWVANSGKITGFDFNMFILHGPNKVNTTYTVASQPVYINAGEYFEINQIMPEGYNYNIVQATSGDTWPCYDIFAIN